MTTKERNKNEIETIKDESKENYRKFKNIGDFLANCPPGEWVYLTDGILNYKDITITCYCDNENDYRNFSCEDYTDIFQNKKGQLRAGEILFRCNNCTKSVKDFFLLFAVDYKSDPIGRYTYYKVGEFPPFGPPTPAKLDKLLGPHKELFRKGLQCENHGLGVGAYAYYRQIVENLWEIIIDQIIKVGKNKKLSADKLQKLEDAKSNNQFRNKYTNVTKSIKPELPEIPEILMINGQHPLLLLYKALSKGLHEMNDHECLAQAKIIRNVLLNFVENVNQVLKNMDQLNKDINALIPNQ